MDLSKYFCFEPKEEFNPPTTSFDKEKSVVPLTAGAKVKQQSSYVRRKADEQRIRKEGASCLFVCAFSSRSWCVFSTTRISLPPVRGAWT